MPKKTVHIVTHTHWDREWYMTFQEFRIRLLDLVDHTLEVFDKDPEFKYFTLDGQTVVLEDYLEVKPEKREKIRDLVKKGKVFIGPWYVLVDEFLVSGEALVRNLLEGRRIARDFGRPMNAGYLPDMFGHVSQIPQILQGFGIDTAVMWRGHRGNPVRSEYMWEAPDGTSVLTYHLPEPGYAMIINLPEDIDETAEIIGKWMKTLTKRSDSKHLLLLNGVDHLEPQPILTKLIRGLNRKFKDYEFIHSHLEEYFGKLKKQNLKLKTIKGELKEGYEHAFILVDILSARMYLKLLNDAAQRSLEKYAEPLNAFSTEEGAEDYSAVVRQAWKYVMQNHPHDTIGGCSIDAVHQDMIHRFRWANQIAGDVCERGLRTLAVSLPDDYDGEKDYRLLVFNPTQYAYTGMMEAELFIPDKYAVERFEIRDYAGNTVPMAINACESDRKIYPRFRNNPLEQVGKNYAVELYVEDMPPMGYRRYKLVKSAKALPTKRVKTRDIDPEIENEHLKVKVNPDGSVNVTQKALRRTFSHLNYFEDGGDAGDEYNFGKPIKDKVYTTKQVKARIIQKETTSFYQKVLVGLVMEVPRKLDETRRKRSDEMVELDILTEYRLVKGSERLDITTIVQNNSSDHRLRAVFPSGRDVATYNSDSKFDVVTRQVKVLPKKDTYGETPTGIKPHDSFVDVSDAKCGLAVITRGTPEHEVVDVKGRPIAITLIRSVGWLSREDGPYRKGNAGPPVPTPEAQGHGIYTFNYSVYPHGKGWEQAEVYRQAIEANTPPMILLTNKFCHDLWKEFPHERNDGEVEKSFFKVKPECFVVTAVKKAEDGDGTIIRVCNLGTRKRKGSVVLSGKPRKASLVNLAEDTVKALKAAEEIPLELRSKEIATVRVKM